MTGYIHSIQSMGTLDGPGVRFVAFLQGCPLRCACCHNPDTWATGGGKPWEPRDLVCRAARYREYFGEYGGITLSGGEPLLQAEFAREVFALSHREGINTCLDTSGCILNDSVKALLAECDRVLLDVKYTCDGDYRRYVGMPLETVLAFLRYLNEQRIKTTLRQVVIPGLNDTRENAEALRKTVSEHGCIDKVELLPFRKLCTVKYDGMGINFPLADVPEADSATVERVQGWFRGEA